MHPCRLHCPLPPLPHFRVPPTQQPSGSHGDSRTPESSQGFIGTNATCVTSERGECLPGEGSQDPPPEMSSPPRPRQGPSQSPRQPEQPAQAQGQLPGLAPGGKGGGRQDLQGQENNSAARSWCQAFTCLPPPRCWQRGTLTPNPRHMPGPPTSPLPESVTWPWDRPLGRDQDLTLTGLGRGWALFPA